MRPTETHFEVLGLPRKYHVAADELEARYHAAAREHHPDRNTREDERKRVSSALRTAMLTEAYRTLRDPVRRAEYLVGLEGILITDEKVGHKVDPAFLMNILELRELLEDSMAAADEPAIERLDADMSARQSESRRLIDEAFHAYDAGDKSVLPRVADQLVALRYFKRFLDEVEAYREKHESA